MMRNFASIIMILFLSVCELPDNSESYDDKLVVFANINMLQMDDNTVFPIINPVHVSMSSSIESDVDNTNELYSNFYKNEMIGKENEEDATANMACQMSDRYRGALERRATSRKLNSSGGGRVSDDGPPDGDIEDMGPMRRQSTMGQPQNDMDPPDKEMMQDQPAEDNVMHSVSKIIESGADGDLEKAFYENLQATASM